ncbi:MAG: MBL fold metallo-hydrolase [Polyangiaceae bacterium]|nr:MBL fold metallo-hydrolase [Polyangiaceae bacterium]
MGCQNQNEAQSPAGAPALEQISDDQGTAAVSSEPAPASAVTHELFSELKKAYPFADRQDFENARRGLIAPLPDQGVVKNKEGRVVWDLQAFRKYIREDEQAPETVNPSLWRQAQLLMIAGLFEVVPGVYQVRGADLSNMTIVEGEKGITIYDPLISEETARYALELYYSHRPKRPVVAVLFSHSHVDHFGGVAGVVDLADVASGKVQVIAPAGFLENAIAENVMAGTAMSRRASYMYGNLLPRNVVGQATAGLGVTTSSGTVSIVQPNDIIHKSGETRIIDGLKYEFISAPGSEAPSEVMWFIPKLQLISTAEDSTHTMHNLYTLRGAKTRDAAKWPRYLNQVLQAWGEKAEVEIAMHHWPTWGNKEVQAHIRAQRDTYKFLHDQTLHLANQGFTMNEIPELISMPPELVREWSSHGYYGSKSHNVRAVYNFYLGYFDGNPAHLNPLPPVEVAERYVAACGGPAAIMKIGREALKKGDYRWGAEILHHLVFAQPENQQAKNLLAQHLEQMGYQAESGPWRNFYLSGALELRQGVQKAGAPNTTPPEVIANMTSDMIFEYMAVQLNAEKSQGRKLTINWIFPDAKEKYALFLENSVLNHWPSFTASDAGLTLTLNRRVLDRVLLKELSFEEALQSGKIKVEGDVGQLVELMSYLDNLEQSLWFNIVTP